MTDWLDGLSQRIGQAASWLTLGMTLTAFVIVVLRYQFDFGSIALQESVIYMHGALFMLGASYALKQDAHVRVDLIYRLLSPRGRAWVDLLGTLLLLLPTMGFLLYICFEYVAAAWRVMEGSPDAGGLNGVWAFKTLLLIMPVLVALQGVAQMRKAWRVIRFGAVESDADASADAHSEEA
ncbi:TRAP transporter small permease subunit [Magnetofaba australis]|uniref:TRAP transporter small permease protein n=1 Tax=Magnetofaba australis IT-1 TaxID=1434232 RepID=A0A1Y2K761_9PROT|nr:TRAP transporter small permease subunit [Magnetofaba australis]OSM04281.1 putative tripartite ATP-independent periplasmic transporter DctQ [Magnetofaba australis IT-1]